MPGKIYEPIGELSSIQHIMHTVVDYLDDYMVKVIDSLLVFLCPNDDHKFIEYFENIEKPASVMPISFFTGLEQDLMDRYDGAMQHYEADGLIRLTCDCPMIPGRLLREAAQALFSYDYASNTVMRSYPDGWDFQACSAQAWEWFKVQSDRYQSDKEHPFKSFDTNDFVRDEFEDAGFKWHQVCDPTNPIFTKLSLDTAEDLKRIRDYYESENTRRFLETEGRPLPSPRDGDQ